MKLIGKIIATLSSITYFFILTILITISFSLNLLSGNYYTNIIKDIDLKSIKASDLGIFDNDNIEKNTTVEDIIVKYITTSGVDEDLAIAVINNQTIKEIAGNFIGEYMNYNITGEKPKIEKKDIEKVLNEPDVKKILNNIPGGTSINIEEIHNALNNLVDEIIKDGGNNNDNAERNINNHSINK